MYWKVPDHSEVQMDVCISYRGQHAHSPRVFTEVWLASFLENKVVSYLFWKTKYNLGQLDCFSWFYFIQAISNQNLFTNHYGVKRWLRWCMSHILQLQILRNLTLTGRKMNSEITRSILITLVVTGGVCKCLCSWTRRSYLSDAHTNIYTHIYIYVHIFEYTHRHTHMYVCIFICIYTYIEYIFEHHVLFGENNERLQENFILWMKVYRLAGILVGWR